MVVKYTQKLLTTIKYMKNAYGTGRRKMQKPPDEYTSFVAFWPVS